MTRPDSNGRADSCVPVFTAMGFKQWIMFRIGTLVAVFCVIVNAQPGTSSKWGSGPHNQRITKCINCIHDLSGRISQNPAAVRQFRLRHPCPATGSTGGQCSGFVVDHIKPLSQGGRDTPENMKWRTITEATRHRLSP